MNAKPINSESLNDAVAHSTCGFETMRYNLTSLTRTMAFAPLGLNMNYTQQ